MPKSKRATKAEKLRREQEVERLVLSGNHDRDIIQYVSEQWDLTERQAFKYVAEAHEALNAAVEEDKDKVRRRIIGQLWAQHAKCREIADMAEARRTLELIVRIYGADAPKQFEVSYPTEIRLVDG